MLTTEFSQTVAVRIKWLKSREFYEEKKRAKKNQRKNSTDLLNSDVKIELIFSRNLHVDTRKANINFRVTSCAEKFQHLGSAVHV